MNNIFHFTYFLPEDQNIAKGVNIEAESMVEAIAIFNLDFGGIEPINVVNKNLYANIRTENITQEEIDELEKQMGL